MAQSFIRQDTNIVCSNMTIFIPRKLGLDPQKELIEFAGISICGKKRVPLLNISDKKLNDYFRCKTPLKIWGGLAAFFIGIAFVAVLVIIVATSEITVPILTTIAAVVSVKTLIGIAVTATVLAGGFICYSVYRAEHDCDKTLEGQWINYHETALIETKPALLNKSQLKCPAGGTLDIILDDILAFKAALFLSYINTHEIAVRWGSKFIDGVITFCACEGRPSSLVISSAIELYETWKEDAGEEADLLIDAITASTEYVISSAVESVIEVIKAKGGSKVLDAYIWLIKKGILPPKAGEKALDYLIKKASHFSWKRLAKDFAKGLIPALITFAIDQAAGKFEEMNEQFANMILDNINEQDQENGNNIGIIASTQ